MHGYCCLCDPENELSYIRPVLSLLWSDWTHTQQREQPTRQPADRQPAMRFNIAMVMMMMVVVVMVGVAMALPANLPASVSAADCPSYPFYPCSTQPAQPAQPANPAGVKCYNFPFYSCSS
ncbi:hypothetical protein Pmani_024305 [Petrolisthes manimaculis]|uniref:Uncharacterized protein n=1 Tax=Petrolisthes manimaculis TaxID=1843537 RepID=A0AAE1P851_9EUCA|nr:hypothetical protein Pmani_024305 [Petrolisthes manimaculis]